MAEATKNKGQLFNNKGTGFNTPAVVMSALAIVIFVYALSLFLQGGFNKAMDLEFQAKVLDTEGGVALEELAAQKAILDAGYRWIDEANGTVGMPIEDAKALVVSQGR